MRGHRLMYFFFFFFFFFLFFAHIRIFIRKTILWSFWIFPRGNSQRARGFRRNLTYAFPTPCPREYQVSTAFASPCALRFAVRRPPPSTRPRDVNTNARERVHKRHDHNRDFARIPPFFWRRLQSWILTLSSIFYFIFFFFNKRLKRNKYKR